MVLGVIALIILYAALCFGITTGICLIFVSWNDYTDSGLIVLNCATFFALATLIVVIWFYFIPGCRQIYNETICYRQIQDES
jgi:hypothetical protein